MPASWLLDKRPRLARPATWLALALMVTLAAGCQRAAAQQLDTPAPVTRTAAVTAAPSALPTLTPYPTRDRSPLRPPPTPRYTPVTPIPPALSGIVRPGEVRLLVLLGTGGVSPFVGRTEAIMLVFYNPRLGMASVLSVPPDLFVHIPGFTMQRLSTAYSVGGFRGLTATLAYNLGVRPDEYVVINADTFDRTASELGGLEVQLAAAYPFQCGGLPGGTRLLDGQQARCYMSFRDGSDELNRMHRQQDVLVAFFRRLVEGGNLVRVPGLYNALHGQVDTNLSLDDLTGAIPIALRVADAGHLGLFQLGPENYREWRIPGALEPVVFLPQQEDVRLTVQQAIDFVNQAEPASQAILTLEAAMTVSPTPTMTRTRVPFQTPGGPTATPPADVTVMAPTTTPSPTLADYPAPGTPPGDYP